MTKVKRVDKLTPEQEAMMPIWRDKWTKIGLSTEKADRPKFEKAVRECYKLAGLPEPKVVVWVSSPIVGAFAAPYAQWLLNERLKKKGDAVRDAVDDAKEALNYINDRKWQRMGGQFWVGGWWGSPSYVSFMQEICGLDLGEDINKRADAYKRTSEAACWWWPYNDFVMVCERPEAIHIENNRLHSDHEMAIRWPDGWGLHFLDGVRFTGEEWQKIVDQKFSLEDLAKEGMGADKSAVAIKYLKPDLLLKHCNAKLIHKGVERYNTDRVMRLWLRLNGHDVPNKGKISKELIEIYAEAHRTFLYQVDNFMNTGNTQYCMRMSHPSIGREYIEWVPPEVGKQKDADLAQASAWRDKDGTPIPVEDWLLAIQA